MRLFLPLLLIIGLTACNNASQNEKKNKTESHKVQKYSIEQFYKNTSIGGGAFSNDETRILVHSDKSGIFNLYEIDLKTGEKNQLTHSQKESLYAIDYVPYTNKILYSADKGGNELSHIYLYSPKDSSVVDLTPEEKEKANFMGWAEDKKNFYYSSNKRDRKYFDLYKLNIDTKKAKLLYKNTEGVNLSRVSKDENYFALTKPITRSSNLLFLKDLKHNKLIEISDSTQAGSYSAAGFSKNSKYFYYITNAGKEFAYLMEYEIETGQRNTLYETNWDIMYSYLSENATYRLTAVNNDGKNTLILKNNKTNTNVDFPKIKDGNIRSANISDSEKYMIMAVGTSKAPGNLYLYNIETKALKKLTETLNPQINPNDLVSAEIIRYKSFDELTIPAIFYKPLNANADNKVPALVWVHGGPGGQSRVGYSGLIQYLVNHGYAVLAVNNRGSSGYGKSFNQMDDRNHGDKDLKDCIYGKKWLAQKDYINAEQIGIIGGSYGGYMTMAAMTFTPDEFKVGINIFGVTNWLRTLRSIPPYWESARNALYKEIGNPETEDSVRLYNISPLFHAHKVKSPIMVLQGANDPRVLKVESDEIVEAVKKNNVPVEYVVFEDEGHGFVKKENKIRGYGKILKFLDKYLKTQASKN